MEDPRRRLRNFIRMSAEVIRVPKTRIIFIICDRLVTTANCFCLALMSLWSYGDYNDYEYIKRIGLYTIVKRFATCRDGWRRSRRSFQTCSGPCTNIVTGTVLVYRRTVVSVRKFRRENEVVFFFLINETRHYPETLRKESIAAKLTYFHKISECRGTRVDWTRLSPHCCTGTSVWPNRVTWSYVPWTYNFSY